MKKVRKYTDFSLFTLLMQQQVKRGGQTIIGGHLIYCFNACLVVRKYQTQHQICDLIRHLTEPFHYCGMYGDGGGAVQSLAQSQ